MNWNTIGKLALALFTAQFVVGFLDGFLFSANTSMAWFLGSYVVSFVVCGALFATFAVRQPSKPFTHAWIALLIQLAAGLAFSQLVSTWLGSTPLIFAVLEYVVLVCALMAGTLIGSIRRQTAGRPGRLA